MRKKRPRETPSRPARSADLNLWPWVAILASASVLYSVLTIYAARVETPTVDEFAHLPAGCAYWKYGSFDLYSKNPPLLKLWMSLPVLAHPYVIVPEPAVHNQAWGPWEYGTAFMNANRQCYLDLFFRARLAIVFLGLLTGGLLFWWARQQFSFPTACIVTTLFLLSPTVLAHGHLATIDIGSAFTILLSVMVLRWSCHQSEWWPLVVSGTAFGVALSVKYTAILLFPVIAILLLFCRQQRRSLDYEVQQKKPGNLWPLRWVRDVAILLLAAVLMVNLLMGFRGFFQQLGQFSFQSEFMRGVQEVLPRWLPVPLPQAYVTGFDAQKLDTETGEFGSYLLGRWSHSGWWYYNIFALLVKEPEPLLILLLLSPWFWRKSRDQRRDSWFLLVPAVSLMFFLSVFNRLNIGIRYLLPALPFLYLLCGATVEAVRLHRWRWFGWLAPCLCMGYYAVTAVSIQPGFLSYFNLSSGGPANGQRLLLDSNLDWGQDLYRVPALVRRLGENESLWLLYFGHVDPGLYGIRYKPVPREPIGGLLAVSVNFLYDYPYLTPLPDGRFAMVSPGHLAWLRSRTPVARLGSIWVFDTRAR